MTATAPLPRSRSVSPGRRVLRAIDETSMYRLTSIVLIALALMTTAISLIPGVLWVSPWQILGSMAVSVASSVIFTQIFARLMHVPAHGESAVITGIILGFLMSPVLDGTAILTLVVANLAAAGSKFVLTFRTRHFLNPAAFGAAFVTLTASFTHLYASLWWIGTGPLLPFVVLAGFVIGYRLRSLGRIAIVVVAFLFPSLIVALAHTDIAQWPATASMVVLASPVWFLAVFMMTEPLTMRVDWAWKWGVVGVFCAMTISLLTPVSIPTEATLLIGNLVVFFCNRRTRLLTTATTCKAEFVAPDIARWTIVPSQPLAFKAGQYVEFDVPHRADRRGRRRMVSIVGVPGKPSFDVVMRIPTPSSSFKQELVELPEGAPIRVTAVGGTFTLPRDPATPVLLIGQGIGITPLVSHARTSADHNEARSIQLIWQVRRASDIVTHDFGDANVTIIAPKDIVDDVRTAVPEAWTVQSDSLAAVVQDLVLPANIEAFISGAPRSVRAMRKAVQSSSIRHIHTDQFVGY